MLSLNNISGAMVGDKEVIGIRLGDVQLVHFPKWRLPEMADMAGGQTMKFVYPDSPVSMITWGAINNSYIISNNGNYMLREIVYVEDEYVDEVNYEYAITNYDATVELFKPDGTTQTIYQCRTNVKQVYDGSDPIINYITELVKLDSIVLPSDFGEIVSYGGSMMNIIPQLDGRMVTKRPYTLANITSSDNLAGLVLFAEYPMNIDKIMFPSIPSKDEYGNLILPDNAILFDINYEYTPPGEEYPTAYYQNYSAQLFEDGYYDENTYEWVGNGTYIFSIVLQEYMQAQTVFQKTYGASTAEVFNNTVCAPSFDVAVPLTALNTSCPLYPYVKKVQWL